MTIQPFITSFRDSTSVHIYFFPGRDERGSSIARMTFLTTVTDYKYVRQSDGSIEYIFSDNVPSQITYRIQNISTGVSENKILRL